MSDNQGVIGIYSYLDSTTEAIEKLKDQGIENFRVFSPYPNHDIEHAVDEPESIVRFFTLGGAVLGATCGFMFTILTSMDWPIQVSGKPIVSVIPYMVIVFEMAVLFGALATLLGLLINSRLRRNAPIALYDPRFSEDKFGVAVVCEKDSIDKVKEILSSAGAEEINTKGFGET